MSEPFLAEVRIFAGSFAPRGWAFCDGQLLPIAQNSAVYSVVNKTYGGDGITTFGLPNLQGRAPMHAGTGPGLSPRPLGEFGGAATTTLNESQLPSHNHLMSAPSPVSGEANSTVASGNTWGEHEDGDSFRSDSDVAMRVSALATSGGGQPHNNMQPYLVVNFIFALIGLFPSRS